MIFYFSGVGNSSWVATQLAEKLADKLVSIVDHAGQPIHIEADEPIGFVFPIYSWAPLRSLVSNIASLPFVSM